MGAIHLAARLPKRGSVVSLLVLFLVLTVVLIFLRLRRRRQRAVASPHLLLKPRPDPCLPALKPPQNLLSHHDSLLPRVGTGTDDPDNKTVHQSCAHDTVGVRVTDMACAIARQQEQATRDAHVEAHTLREAWGADMREEVAGMVGLKDATARGQGAEVRALMRQPEFPGGVTPPVELWVRMIDSGEAAGCCEKAAEGGRETLVRTGMYRVRCPAGGEGCASFSSGSSPVGPLLLFR